eukprot:4532858-Pleurochrysis_carterae.AAC.1
MPAFARNSPSSWEMSAMAWHTEMAEGHATKPSKSRRRPHEMLLHFLAQQLRWNLHRNAPVLA